MKKNINAIVIFLLLTSILILILSYPKEVIDSVSFSISIWKDNLFPSLFPFLIIGYFLTSYGISDVFSEITKPFITNILHLPASCGFTLIASLLSGFPSSAGFIKEQLKKGEITIKEADYLLSFCHFSSPLFVIGTIGSLLLGDKKLGYIILLSHYLGNLIIALLFRQKNKTIKEKIYLRKGFREIKRKIVQSTSFVSTLKHAIKNALEVLFLLLGIVTVFLIITNLITTIIPFSTEQKAIFSGILEMTQGIKNASLLNTSLLARSLFMLAIISFGGLSVHTQIFSILSEYKLSYKRFLISRFLHVVFSCCVFILLCELPII